MEDFVFARTRSPLQGTLWCVHLCLRGRSAGAFPRDNSSDSIRRARDVFELHSSILHRLEWFEVQSAHHLIGEIDYQATANGTIVCKDGFRATTADRQSFEKLAASLEVIPRITEVDGSCLFCTVFRERRPYMRRGSLCQQAVHRFENALDTFGNRFRGFSIPGQCQRVPQCPTSGVHAATCGRGPSRRLRFHSVIMRSWRVCSFADLRLSQRDSCKEAKLCFSCAHAQLR
jgi:hypothetical protein